MCVGDIRFAADAALTICCSGTARCSEVGGVGAMSYFLGRAAGTDTAHGHKTRKESTLLIFALFAMIFTLLFSQGPLVGNNSVFLPAASPAPVFSHRHTRRRKEEEEELRYN